jgi:NADPH:quinone reductase-like Zn-dependent oxidoreductase
MRSITHDQYGEPAKVLRLEHVTDPRPPEGEEVLIRVVARPVNIGALLGVRERYRVSGLPTFGDKFPRLMAQIKDYAAFYPDRVDEIS